MIEKWLESLPRVSTIYHGACIGIDAMVAQLAWQIGHKVVAVIPAVTSQVAIASWKHWSHFVIYAPEGRGNENAYRARNKLLVRQLHQRGGLLKAYWNGNKRSGTYMTINIAKSAGVPVEIERL